MDGLQKRLKNNDPVTGPFNDSRLALRLVAALVGELVALADLFGSE